MMNKYIFKVNGFISTLLPKRELMPNAPISGKIHFWTDVKMQNLLIFECFEDWKILLSIGEHQKQSKAIYISQLRQIWECVV